jgi:hypothetical protein
MSDETQNVSPERELNAEGDGVNHSRRRMGSAGAAVLLTLPSRSVMAASTCTASEIASGNMSRTATANSCGCSPGFWGPQNMNGTQLWNTSPKLYSIYPRTLKFNTVFGVNFFNGAGGANITLDQVFPGQTAGPGSGYPNQYGAADSTAMQAVAALLNAQYYGSRYPVTGLQTPSAVIAAFQSACSGPSPSSSLASFVSRVNIYGSTPNLWCNGAAA